MYADVRGLALATGGPASVGLYDEAVSAYLGAREEAADRAEAAASTDPACVLAQCLQGYLLMHQATPEARERARQALERTTGPSVARSITGRERLHVRALSAWIEGDLTEAVSCWEAILRDHPLDILALRLAQFMTSYLGDSEGIRDSVARVLRFWDDQVPGYSFVLGCYAYGLEETGEYSLAEDFGRRAVERNPEDLWAAHAVTHVMEMQGRPRDGIAWIENLRQNWHGCNNFVFHVEWHRCLFHLALKEFDHVLDLYDREVRARSTGEYLDIANASALLWRLEQAGLEVGERWAELAERAAEHLGDHLFVFADLHYILAVAAGGPPSVTDTFLKSCAEYAEFGDCTEARIMGRVGLSVARALVLHRRRAYAEAVEILLPVRFEFRRIGGSHAQRDLFDQLLIDSARRAGRSELARSLLGARSASRPEDVWTWRELASLLASLGDSEGATAANRTVGRLLGRIRTSEAGGAPLPPWKPD